jgi:sarcosine oxidase delta subunit
MLIIICPYCNEIIIIEELNCCIFRHGVLKTNMEQINPHSSEEKCKYYINNNLIYGCGKPFKINVDNLTVEKCDYI